MAGGLFLCGAAYLLAHLWTLAWFPFVHSDEAWLASLTRAMWEQRSVAATEDFFVLTPRHPHALKTLFHLIQLPFLQWQFSPTGARLPSLIAFGFTLFFTWQTCRALYRSRIAVALVVGLMALDLQMIYIAHLARTEAILVAIMAWAFSHWARTNWNVRDSVVVGLVLGMAIGVHPNAFVIAAPLVAVAVFSPRVSVRARVVLLVTLAALAAAFLAASLLMDPRFFTHYREFGETVGVTDNPIRRLFNLRDFFLKLFHRYAGTYYLPPVRVALIVFGAATIVGFVVARREGVVRAMLLALLATIAAQFIVGKYSPPSAVFYWLPGYLLCGALVDAGLRRWRSFGVWPTAMAAVLGAILLILAALTAGREVARFRHESYEGYLQQISQHVPRDAKVLANLNTAFYFAPGALRVWRDLSHLPVDGGGRTAIGAFLASERVEYVLYPDELDLIYAERPIWNIVYGNLYPYYDELNRFLGERCELVAVIDAPRYAMRILPRVDGSHRLRIYRVH